MDKDKLKVVPIQTDAWRDIPAMLRRIADQMEQGETPVPRSVLMLHEVYPNNSSMYLEVFNLGEANDAARMIGLFSMAAIQTAQYATGDVPRLPEAG